MPFFGEKGWECFAVSMRGHGGSEPASSSASTMDEQIEDLASLMHTMQRAPILVAHSLGGIVAQRCVNTPPGTRHSLYTTGEARVACPDVRNRGVRFQAVCVGFASVFPAVRAGI